MNPENKNHTQDPDEDPEQAFLPKSRESEDIDSVSFPEKTSSKKRSAWRRYLQPRLILEITMGLTIAALLSRPPFIPFPFSGDEGSAVPKFPRKRYTFLEDAKYLREDMFESREETLRMLHNWIPLSSDGRGYVQIDDPDSFGLGEPYMIQSQHSEYLEPVYMMSVFHQLHCLSYLTTHYQTAFNGSQLSQEIAHHSTHCIDYLRQSIMCNADTSLEGKTEAGPGWGSKHVCTDYDALLGWANERTVVKWRTNMPGEATL